MKILYGITKSNFGGAQRYVFDMAVGARNAGHDVSVLCGLSADAKSSGLLAEKLREESIQVIPLPHLGRDISLIKDFKSLLFIIQILKRERPDVFHTNSSKMGLMGNVAARIVGIKKIVFTGHGWAFNENRSLLQKLIIKELIWYTLLLSHKTICVSKKTERDVSWMPFIKNKLTVIYTGINKFDLVEREDSSLTIGTIAELHKIKGLDVLLNAWKSFTNAKPAKLVIIGEGGERKYLENMAKELGISDSVVFKGFVHNARSFLSTFDIFVLPSRSEAMPYSVLEAGLAGLPVIATSVGGIPEIIENGTNGILIERENEQELVTAMIKLSEDSNLRMNLAENLKKKIETEFSTNKMIENTLKSYLL